MPAWQLSSVFHFIFRTVCCRYQGAWGASQCPPCIIKRADLYQRSPYFSFCFKWCIQLPIWTLKNYSWDQAIHLLKFLHYLPIVKQTSNSYFSDKLKQVSFSQWLTLNNSMLLTGFSSLFPPYWFLDRPSHSWSCLCANWPSPRERSTEKPLR